MNTLREPLTRVYPLHVESGDYVCIDCGGVNTCPVPACARSKSVPPAQMQDIEEYFMARDCPGRTFNDMTHRKGE